MSGYMIQWEVNENTGRWNKSHSFWAENDYKAIVYTMQFMEDEQVFKLTRTGFNGFPIRIVINSTDSVC